MLGQIENEINRNRFRKNPCCRISLHTMPRKVKKKSDKSRLAAYDSVKSKTAPTHALVCPAIRHFPCTEANHHTFVLFIVDKKMLCGAKNFVDSLIAVFADVGDTFKESKYFSDHIFYWLRLEGNQVVVKGENFAITV